MSETCCTRLAGNTERKKSPFWHHCTTLSGHIFATKARIDNRKKLLNSNTSSTCPRNMVNFGLAAEICWRVWGTRANLNGFRVLAALLHGILVVGVSHTLRRWTEGATYINRQSVITIGIGTHSSPIIIFFFSSSPNLSGRRLDVNHTHMVWPQCEFRMHVWNERTHKIAKNSPSGHRRTTLSRYIFATKARIDNHKKTC